MTAKSILSIAAVIALSSCFASEDRELRCLIQPLARDTTFTDIAKYYAVAWKEAA